MSTADPSNLATPKEGSKVEFWPKGMPIVHEARGIVGTLKDGRFWSHDLADQWAPSEIHLWAYLGWSKERCVSSITPHLSPNERRFLARLRDEYTDQGGWAVCKPARRGKPRLGDEGSCTRIPPGAHGLKTGRGAVPVSTLNDDDLVLLKAELERTDRSSTRLS